MIKNNELIFNGIILSLPGLLSIIISLIAIPIHLSVAGAENYGNYIIFHLILTISVMFNIGIGKSIVISIGSFPQKNKIIAYQGLKYTLLISILIASIFILLKILNGTLFEYFFTSNTIFKYFIICIISTIFYVSLEAILQGNEKYKSLSLYNFLFFSLSLSLPSLSLLYDSKSTLDNLLLISTYLKVFTIFAMLTIQFVVPNSINTAPKGDNVALPSKLGSLVRDGQLSRLNGGVFILHMALTACFVTLPKQFVASGLVLEQHWQLYLPTLLGSFFLMVPFMIIPVTMDYAKREYYVQMTPPKDRKEL